MLRLKPKRVYYKSRQEAVGVRTPGNQIYYDADEMAYYIVDTKNKSVGITQATRHKLGDVILLVGCGLAFALFIYGGFYY